MVKIVWLYGLAGSGKTTLARAIADLVPEVLVADADIFRYAWSPGFTEHEKMERGRSLLRVAEKAAVDGRRVVVASITPYVIVREMAREAGAMLVHVDAPPEVCAQRKPELYERAVLLAGKDAVFQSTSPDVTCYTDDRGTPEKQALVVAIQAGWMEDPR